MNRDGEASSRSHPTRVEVGSLAVDGSMIGEALQSRRKDLGLPIDAVAKKAGIGAATVHAVEHGNLSIGLDRFLALLGALNLKPLDVLGTYVVDPTSTASFERELARRARSNLPSLLSTILQLIGEQLGGDSHPSQDPSEVRKRGRRGRHK